MFENVPDDVVYVGGVTIVSLLVIGRLYAGEYYFNDRARFWNPLRRHVIPLLHRLFQRQDGELYAETRVRESELVDVVDRRPEAVLEDLAAAGYEPNPLASLATDWTGKTEIASWAHYEGPRPFHGAPHFPKPRQIHVRLFPREEGTAITAHEEANPWRLDQWQDHYRDETLDVEHGVAVAAFDLGLDHIFDELASAIQCRR
ncbi:hypothetical protein [Halosolutus halophilus]|uniref:hypothetical protein n=1 Tax=Halosolutus halophilus TaxID=1552990 RepID=UPI002234EFD7|nr:hypothetical protein [Halosolutus halophilus]